MNIVILTAGGIGSRMNQTIPKQFMKIYDKPLLIYTALRFQNCNSIDGIVIVCLSGWKNKVYEMAKEYGIDKLLSIVEGGSTGQESIKNGFKYIRDNYDDDDIVLIHDGNRPMVSEEIINKGINTCRIKGNAVAYIPCQEVMFLSEDMISSKEQIERSKLARTQTPHVYKVRDIENIYKMADENGYKDCVAICSLCQKLGIETYLYQGSEKNIKITTQEDIDIFKALLTVEMNKWYENNK